MPERAELPVHAFARRLRSSPAPLEALRRVAPGDRPFLRYVGSRGFRGYPWSFLAFDPVEVRAWRRLPSGRLAEVLSFLRPHPLRRSGEAVPFSGGWAGTLGYEARSAVERTPPPRLAPLGFPTVWLGRYPAVLAWDHRRRRAFVTGTGASPAQARRRAAALANRVLRVRPRPVLLGSLAPSPRPSARPAAFQASVEAVRQAVLRGDIFQANLSQRFDARFDGDPLGLFLRLAAAQPAPYMTFVGLGEGRAILSASPERFLRVAGGSVETDPMKGTRPRGADPLSDRRLREDLETSEKDRAELAMIVDLCRNDLARVCRAGTVRVRVARRLVPFPRVHQAIAVVRGRLAPGKDRTDLLEAAFPPGSVTGAPKVRAMEWIDDLEGEARGPYCGAVGWFDEGGDADLAVAIRTIVVSGRRASYRVGGGITLRSDPVQEWRETIDKGRGLFAALAGREDDS